MLPEYKDVKAHCNQCQHETNHRVMHVQSRPGHDAEEGYSWETKFEMLECRGCEDVMLRREFYFSENDGLDVTCYPPRTSRRVPKWAHSLSSNMTSLLTEVYTALHADSRRLAMMGARTVIETAMVSTVGDRGTFADNLQALEDEGYVSKTNRQHLEAALDAGNAAAHRAHVPTSKQLDTTMDIVENLLQSLFVLTKPSAELKAAIPPRPSRVKKSAVKSKKP